jgi:hypothetical protein
VLNISFVTGSPCAPQISLGSDIERPTQVLHDAGELLIALHGLHGLEMQQIPRCRLAPAAHGRCRHSALILLLLHHRSQARPMSSCMRLYRYCRCMMHSPRSPRLSLLQYYAGCGTFRQTRRTVAGSWPARPMLLHLPRWCSCNVYCRWSKSHAVVVIRSAGTQLKLVIYHCHGSSSCWANLA